MEIATNDAELTVASYNIFFGKLETDTNADIQTRIQLLCSEILDIDADVICLQEVLPDRYVKIRSYLNQIYPYAYPETITQSYDTAILSKTKFVKKSKIKFSITDMGRSIRFATIKSPFDDSKTIGIGNSHFESEFGDKLTEQNVKMIQYVEAVDILEQVSEMCEVSDIIFCGDFNSHNDLSDTSLYKSFEYSPNKTIGKNWRDAWIETGRELTKEMSFDSKTNLLLRRLYSSLTYPPTYVSRLDRILHRSRFFVHSFEMTRSSLMVSDHYPIIAKFKTERPTNTIEYVPYDPDKIALSRTRVRNRSSKALSSKLKTISLFK